MQYPLKLRSKMEDASTFSKIQKSECPDIWIHLPRHKWPKSWSSMEDPVIPLERNLYGHPLAGLSWERQFQKVLFEHSWEKVPNWECPSICSLKTRIILIGIRGLHQNGWTEAEYGSHVADIDEKR